MSDDADIILLQQILTRPVAYHPALARATGSVTAAVFMSQAIYWQDHIPQPRPKGCPGPDWFFKTMREWKEETGLSRYEQETARKKLVKLGVLEEKPASVPKRLYYRVNMQTLKKVLLNQQSAGKPHSRVQEGSTQECGIPADKSAGKPHSRVQESRILPRDYPENTHTPPPGLQPESEQGGGGDQEIEEYLMLGCKYGYKGGPVNDPASWSNKVRRRIGKQGGMKEVDMQQLKQWRKKQAVDQQDEGMEIYAAQQEDII